ncbi:MAG: hypothetical protein ACI8T1_004669, partial [Verrucomicrobiales bacterium]
GDDLTVSYLFTKPCGDAAESNLKLKRQAFILGLKTVFEFSWEQLRMRSINVLEHRTKFREIIDNGLIV